MTDSELLIEALWRLQHTMARLGCHPVEIRLTQPDDIDRLRSLFRPLDFRAATELIRDYDEIAGTKLYCDQPNHPAAHSLKLLVSAVERAGFDVIVSPERNLVDIEPRNETGT